MQKCNKRVKISEIEYHHAFTQTGPAMEQIQKIKENILCRETQTVELRRSAIVSCHGDVKIAHFIPFSTFSPQDTSNDRSTQHFGDANELLYMQDGDDIEKETHDYETHEEEQKRKKVLEKVILIQRNFRRYRLQTCIKICAAEYRRLMTIKKKREERVKRDYINSYKKSGDFPRSKKDFDMLFAQIATWKEGEVEIDFTT
jgi:IQ and ubiquitin-like domain-containing protein